MTAAKDDPGAGDLPELVIGDGEAAIVDMLRELARGALAHPEAARALFQACAQEGRSFAETAEGKRWKERLLRSALLQRATLVWQSATLWLTEDAAPDGVTPSALVDAVAAAAASPARESILERFFRELDREQR